MKINPVKELQAALTGPLDPDPDVPPPTRWQRRAKARAQRTAERRVRVDAMRANERQRRGLL